MPFCLAVTMTAKEGEEEAVAMWLVKAAEATRTEPGCIMFLIHRDPADSRLFFIYEQFVDRAAHGAHLQTVHFKEIAEAEIMPRIEIKLWEIEPL